MTKSHQSLYNLFQFLLATDNAVGYTTSRQPTTVVSAATGPADPVSARPVPVLTVARHCDSDCVISPSSHRHLGPDWWPDTDGRSLSLSLFSCHLASAGTLPATDQRISSSGKHKSLPRSVSSIWNGFLHGVSSPFGDSSFCRLKDDHFTFKIL